MERPHAENVHQESVGQNPVVQPDQLNVDQEQGGGQQQQQDQSVLPEDLEHLMEDVGDGEFEPDVQQVLEIQHQAGVGQGQLSTQQFEERFFLQ